MAAEITVRSLFCLIAAHCQEPCNRAAYAEGLGGFGTGEDLQSANPYSTQSKVDATWPPSKKVRSFFAGSHTISVI